MARQPRFKIAGVTQLITQRGNNKQAVFFSEQDYQYYLDILNEAAMQQQCQIHAFVLIANHIHILATPATADGISQLMKSVSQRYVSYINRLEKRTGTLWDGRYKASLIENGDYILACMHYIETTPVRLSLVENPIGYQWSSYQANARGKEVGLEITHHKSYNQLESWINKSDKDLQEKYKLFFREQKNEKESQQIDKAIRSNSIVGSDEFQASVSKGLTPK
ncbi:MAG: transposase [Candidatus Thioglobus sp.]